MKKLFYISAILFSGVIFSSEKVNAQINPLINMYYQNQYQANPAMAAVEKGLVLNGVYKHGFIANNPTNLTNAFTAEYQINPKMGVGLNINTDKDGLINANRYAVTYAYHLPVTKTDYLHFGISAGISTERLNMSEVVGDANDPLVQQYGNLDPYGDVDFGVAYVAEKFTVQAVAPNLRSIIYDTENNLYLASTLYAAVSYRYKTDDILLEPKLAFRSFKNYDSIVDIGINAVLFDDKFNVFSLYHTSNNFTAGLGYKHQKQFQFQVAYVAPTTAYLNKSTSGSVEIGLRVVLFNN